MASNKFSKDYLLNNYRSRDFGNKTLVTTDHGSWIMLSKEEFNFLKKHNFFNNPELVSKLESKGIIITEENKGQIIDLLRKRYQHVFNGTSLHIVIPTLRCNMKCVYCHAASKPLDSVGWDMDEETAKKTVDFIFQSTSKAITIEFQGGEPLLNFEIVKFVIKYAKELNKKYKKDLMFNVVTNLTLMDDSKFNYFIKEEIGICTSLDGPGFLHNTNRPFPGGNGSYGIVEKWIKKFSSEYEKRDKDELLNALITVTRFSLKYPTEIVDEYVRLGFKNIHLRFLNNLGDARPIWNKIGYTPAEFLPFWKKALDHILELNKKGIKIRERTGAIFAKKILTETDANFLDLRTPCGAAIGQLAYTPDGNIYTCDEARMLDEDLFRLGNVKQNSYLDIIKSKKTCSIVLASTNEGQICDYCVYKPYCGICPVCNFAEQGSIIAKIPETPRCKIYMAQFDYVFNKLQDSSLMKLFNNWTLGFDLSRNEQLCPE